MNSPKLKVLYLYSELVAYNISFFKTLVENYNAEIHVVSWDKKKLKPYTPPSVNGVFYYKRSTLTSDDIFELAKKIVPDIIYVSGWMDKGYFKTLRYFKDMGIPVITGFDDQWVGSSRQVLGSWFYKLYLKNFFSHAWVAGPRQFEFARRLGFKNKNIIYDLLSCDTNLFSISCNELESKKANYPKSFLYVGNFRKVKGSDILIQAFKKFRDYYKGDWELICIGNGELKNILENESNVKVIDFIDQDSLLEYAKNSGVFILPSRHDQWGVVVHESCCMGMPMILSEYVGAKDVFFIENYNGISFSNNSIDELAKAMLNFSKKSNEELVEMGKKSIILSTRISLETSAANFVSLIKKD